MTTRIQKRPDRGTAILHELETHFGRSYTVDMVMMALGYKEFERSATRQAVTDLNRHAKITRTSRGRYMAVQRYRSGVTPADTTPLASDEALSALRTKLSDTPTPALVEEAVKSPEPTPEAKPLAVVNDDLTLSPVTAGRPALFQEYIETVHVIGRSTKSDKWIGIGMSDGTLYQLEEL